MGKQHNATLDGLRGIAAAAVVIYHETHIIHVAPARGYLAVDFFFLLSGYVISNAYETRLLTGAMGLKAFLTARLIRLYPLILLGVLCGLTWQIGEGPKPDHLVAGAAFGLLLLPPWFAVSTNLLVPLDPPLWSLMFELWANVAYAVLVRSRRFAWIAAGCMIVGFAGILYTTYNLRLVGGSTFPTFGTGAARVLFSFFAGILMARILTPARLDALAPAVPFPVLAIALFAALCVPWKFGTIYDAFAVAVIFPAIIVLGAKDRASEGWRRAALFAGGLSYPVYALHYVTVMPLVDRLQGRAPALLLPMLAVAFLACLAVAWAAWNWYDEPVRAWLGRKVRRRPAETMVIGAGD